MKLMLLVPGQSEYAVIPYLLSLVGLKIGRPHRTDTIAYNEEKRCVIVSSRTFRQVRSCLEADATKIILIFDREKYSPCPGDFARMVRSSIENNVDGIREDNFSVICADHCVENWILAKPDVFRSNLFRKQDLANRFADRADCSDALSIIREGFSIGYIKTKHLPALAQHIKEIDHNMRRRSPSLDKFLREAGI